MTNSFPASPAEDSATIRATPAVLVILPMISGFLLWASFFAPTLAWVALIPLSLLIRLPGPRGWVYTGAWVGGFLFFALGTYWVSYCAPWVWVGWLLLSAYLACYFPLFILLARICHRRWRVPQLFAVPLVWVLLEYIRMHALSGFGWLMISHSVYTWTSLIQIADTAGVYGVSFVLAMGNALGVELLTLPIFLSAPSRVRLNPAISWRVIMTGLMVAGTLVYGYYQTSNVPLQPGIRLAIVQTNVPQDVRNDVDRSDEYFRSVWNIGRQAENIPADAIVFPETSYPYWYGELEPGLTDLEAARKYQERVTAAGQPLREKPTHEMGKTIRDYIQDEDKRMQAMAKHLAKPILMGSAFWSIRLTGARLTNSSVLITPEEGRVGRYDKVHLVPFGEYIPLGGYIPFIRFLVPYPADFNYDSDAGDRLISLHAGKLNLAPLICFEDTIPDLTRQYLRQATPQKPVEVLINQSNDGWFNNSVEAWYHLSAAVFRTVESRRPMVRSSNTGLTNLVNSLGQVTHTFEREGKKQGIDGLLLVDVPLDTRETWYVRLGDWLIGVCAAIVGGCVVLSFIRQVRLIRRSTQGTSNP
jgi:apolipoprotein N-acyltransferase